MRSITSRSLFSRTIPSSRLDWRMEIGEPATLVLSQVRLDLARKEMRFLSYIDSKEVLSRSVSKVDPRASPEQHLKSRDENE